MRKAKYIVLTSLLGASVFSVHLNAQQNPPPAHDDEAPFYVAPLRPDLPLDPAQYSELRTALEQRNYERAETILIDEIARDSKSIKAGKLLAFAGGIFFLNREYLNAAIAWKKAEAIAPLDERSRFTLAMAYTKINRSDWAGKELEKLAAEQPRNALYLYWLARLDYHTQQYNSAIERLKKVVELDPQMMRAYDSLGLCYDYLGQYDEAIQSYHRAVELNRKQSAPSPWPHLNLALALIAVNRLTEAENHLREAIRYDSALPQAHYQLGQLLEKQGKYGEAIESLRRATSLDQSYADPYYTLGRIFQKQGQTEQAKRAVEMFQRLKGKR
ncbi:MAG: tetratricopeptide repeat protein [Ktedonobacteraceae bacterium]|nr:tetratricopeptide repeat protein [Ktedonobacteraceae bacterium]